MSWTKNFYHEEICANVGFPDEEEYYFSVLEEREEETAAFVEIVSEIFADRRIDFKGYEEFDCPLCFEPNTTDECHKDCHDDERAWSELASEFLPRHAI